MAGVFDGIKVLDFTWAFAGPVTTKYLADHGATVIRVESHSHLCVLRTSPPYVGGVPDVDRAAYFAMYSPNKLGMSLNLAHPKGKELLRRLVGWADVLTESFAAGVMERLGFGYEQLKGIKPDIIMLRASMQGQTGPHARLRGTGVNLVGLAGFVSLTGWPNRTPSQPYGPYTDVIAPHFAAAMLIAALDYRRKTGKGQLIDLSQYETGVNFIAPLLMDYFITGNVASRRGNLDDSACPHNAYPCRGVDRWCAIAVTSQAEWQAFCRVIGSPQWASGEKFASPAARKQNAVELDELIAVWTTQRTPEEIMALMQAAGVPAGVVQNTQDLSNDPQLKHRCHFWSLQHRAMGQLNHVGQPGKLSKTPAEPRIAAPCLGEHTQDICMNILGMTDEQYVELLIEGVFE